MNLSSCTGVEPLITMGPITDRNTKESAEANVTALAFCAEAFAGFVVVRDRHGVPRAVLRV
jgi:hypothetical protein